MNFLGRFLLPVESGSINKMFSTRLESDFRALQGRYLEGGNFRGFLVHGAKKQAAIAALDKARELESPRRFLFRFEVSRLVR